MCRDCTDNTCGWCGLDADMAWAAATRERLAASDAAVAAVTN
jgi:hypothetical protein